MNYVFMAFKQPEPHNGDPMKTRAVITLLLFSIFILINVSLADDSVNRDTEQAWKALNTKAVGAYRQGHYAEALKHAKKAYEYARQHFGPEYPKTLSGLNNLAFLYEAQGRYGEAEPLYRKALELRRKVLGPEHPNTLNSHLNFSGLLVNQGKQGQALTQLKSLEQGLRNLSMK